MAKATIKTKSGALVTVEGTEQEVSVILSHMEHTTAVGRMRASATKAAIIKRDQRKRMTASDLVIELKENGYFNKPHSLLDISKILEEKGYIYPVTTLSGVMIGLVQKKLLGRKKQDGKWVYGR